MTSPSIASDLIERLVRRASIRRQIPGRKSVQEGAPDRIADLLEEASSALSQLTREVDELREAGRRALNYLENTEGEFGINLESADMLREALSRSSGRVSDAE